MPTMTAIALDRLLEPNSTANYSRPPPTPKPPLNVEEEEEGFVVERKEGVGLIDEDLEVNDAEDEDAFLDSRDILSVASSSDTEDGGSTRRLRSGSQTPLSSQTMSYDATDDFFSDGSKPVSSPSMPTKSEVELRALRLNLFEEIERKKQAEEELLHMQNLWQRLDTSLFQVRLPSSEIQYSGCKQMEVDPATFCQEIVVMRYVSEAIEKGIARAEAEAVLEEVIETKNHEISRLRDRLQYYEAMNREMSQRNQEAFESTRQQRLKRRRRQRTMWTFIGLSVTIGTSLLAYSYFSNSAKSTSPTLYTDDPSTDVESVECEASQHQ